MQNQMAYSQNVRSQVQSLMQHQSYKQSYSFAHEFIWYSHADRNKLTSKGMRSLHRNDGIFEIVKISLSKTIKGGIDGNERARTHKCLVPRWTRSLAVLHSFPYPAQPRVKWISVHLQINVIHLFFRQASTMLLLMPFLVKPSYILEQFT